MTPTYLRDLQAFCLAADLASIAAAARSLGESSGSVSKRVSRLEREVGLILLQRSTRSVRLTEDGVHYRQKVGLALDLIREASEEADRSSTVPSGWLRIACTPGLALRKMPDLIKRFVDKFPEIKVELLVGDQAPNFSTHRIDAAIFPATRELKDSTLIARKLYGWTNLFVASPDYLRNSAPCVKIDDLEHHQVILGGGIGFPELVLQVELRKNGDISQIDIHGTLISNDIGFARKACLNGSGIGILPSTMVEQDIRHGRLVEVLTDWSIVSYGGNHYLLYPSSKIIPPRLRVFVDWLDQQVGAEQRGSDIGADSRRSGLGEPAKPFRLG